MKAPLINCWLCDGTGANCQRCGGTGCTAKEPTCPACASPLVCATGHEEPWCYSCGYNVPKSCPDCATGEMCDLHAGERPSHEYEEDAEVWAKLPDE